MKSKRILSLILAIGIIIGAIPIGEIVAWASQEVRIDTIVVNKYIKDYRNKDEAYYNILVTGQNITNIGIGVRSIEKERIIPATRNPEVRNEFTAPASAEYESQIYILYDGEVQGSIDVELPEITDREPEKGIVNTSEDYDIKINVSGKTDKVEGKLYKGSSSRQLKLEGNYYTLKDKADIKEDSGLWNVSFKKHEKEYEFKSDKIVSSKIDLKIEGIYNNIFSLRKNFNIKGDIKIFPTQGPVGTTTTITAEKIESGVSIFLMNRSETEGKEEKYKYTKDNMVDNATIRHLEGNNEDKLVFDIPNIPLGSYDIVLTNRIIPNQNIEGQITKYKILGNGPNKLSFRVVDGSSSVDLRRITPNYSSIKGIKAKLEGRNMGRISNNIYVGGSLDGSPSDGNLINEPSELTLKYTGGKYNGEEIEKLTRKITVQIGTNIKFTGYNFIGDVFDYLDIIVPENDDLDKPIKDVIIFIEDEIDFGNGRKVTTTEMDSIKNGFSYKEIDYQPEINTIIPNIIQVDDNNKVVEDIVISITGKNFLKYGYMEGNQLKIKTPEISVANQNKSKEWFDNNNIRIYEKSGVELENKEGEQLGTIIKVRIKKGSEIPSNIINNPSDLIVQNPLAVESDGDKGSIAEGQIKFVKVGADKTPAITEVNPNIITIDGQNGIKIKGSNFDRNVKVYLDGVEIRGVQRNGTGTELTFNAPPKAEGIYQIIVQNEEGGLATYDEFVYTKTYTDIKLTDFNPKRGSANTLVTVKGENFVQPDPLVFNLEGIGINKLIGTRVLLGGQDVNKYSMENGKITLKDYASSEDNKIIKIEDGRLKLSDYYHSVILEDETSGYYTIFFDTFSGQVKLTDGDKITYILEKKVNEDKIIAKRDGQEYDLIVNTSNLEIKASSGAIGKTLKFRTPYEVEKDDSKGDKITGNKVKVINKNELIFTVPPMPREGYYDLTVINPDTKRDSKTGNNGFWYNYQPDIKPIIKEINPNEGSVDGEYYINISGEGFIDNGGDNKTSVIIGSVRVPPKDVEVLVDGKTLKVKVPKYPGNLASETDMDRKSVAVVVVNPDGGSDSMEDGFSYIIPISHPRIDRLILNKGSAAGGDSIIIEGSGFRFFEPFKDLNNNSQWDEGEPFTDLNRPKNAPPLYKPEWDDLRYWLSNANKEKYDRMAKDYENLVKPILPKVYFGGKEVEIIDFTASTIEVKTPRGEQGSIEVYLVNNDHGVSNKLNYNYEASNPKITSITPSTGRRQGKDKVEILGEGFHESNVNVIQGKSSSKNQDLQVIQFGSPTNTNMSNSNIPLDAPENSGRIRDRLATVKVGNLTVKYDGTKDIRKLSFSIIEDKIEYKLEDVDYDDGEIFLPVDLLKNSQGEGYKGYEYVRVMLERVTGATTTRRLRVDRGFSPKASLVNPSQALVETPSYYTVGKVPVALINPDGGKATGNFEYRNPDSNPVITDIKRDGESGYDTDDGRTIVEVPYSGGNLMEIIGRDFRKPVKVKIGDFNVNAEIEYEPENESPSNKLIFTMPAMDEKYIGEYLRVVVENEDGGVATSEPIYIHFTRPESLDMEITKVTPNFGPTAGRTRVTIEGKDFRQTMDGKNGELKVYFGKGINQVRVPSEDIISISFDKIVLKTPPYRAGLTDIKVENPDGNIVTLKDGFNYVSSPRIISVVDSENDKFIKETLSVEGGERVKIIGNDFMEGARVIFNPVLKLVEDDSQATGDIVTIDDKKYIILSGSPGTEVERVDGQTILTTTPAGKLGDKGVIVINPDKGGTNVYNVVYGIPEMASPFDVRAEIVFDQFIRVNWTGPKDAVEYEIHMSQNGGKFEFIGTTELNSYAVQKLKPDTKYQFLIKAMGKYGTSKPIDESKSNIVTTGKEIGPIDIHGKPAEKTEIKRNGGQVDVIVGSKDFTTKGIVIDLTKGELVGVKDLTIRIPASVVSSSQGKIQVLGKDYRMNFQPKIFKTSTIEANKSKNDAGVVFKISSHKENIDLKPGQTIVGGRYNLEAVTYVDKELSEMDYINGKLNFVLDQDALIIKNRKLQNIKLVRYDNSSKTWVDINSENRLGLYTLIGSRR